MTEILPNDQCLNLWCEGTYALVKEDDCSCHLHAPCPTCQDAYLACKECGETPEEALSRSLRQQLYIAQQEFCKKNNLPMFAFSICPKCKQEIVDSSWTCKHITGCKLCNKSFCD